MAKNQVIVSVTSNVKGLQKGLSDGSSALSSFGKVAALAAAAAAAAVVAIGVKAVKSASELEQNLGAMDSVFKESSAQMNKWAGKAASSVGLAKSEYAGLSTVLGAQLKNMGVSTDQLAGKTNDLIGVGADLAAQFGGSTSDAVSAISSLLRGERDPIEKYGVSLKQVDINAKLAEMGLSGLQGEALKSATTQATLALLYEQTADAQGAFARESTTLAGAQQRLSAGTENLYATLGTSLLPAVTAVTAALGALVNRVQESEAFQAFTGFITDASNSFADFIFNILNGGAELGNFDLSAFLVNAVSGLMAMRATMVDAILGAIPAIVAGLVSSVPQIVSGMADIVSTIVEIVASTAPALLTAGVELFSGILSALVTVAPSVITTLATLIPSLIQTLVGMIPTLLTAAVTLFTSILNALVQVAPTLIEALIGLLPQLITTLLSLVPAILEAAIQLFNALVDALPVIIPMLITAIIDMLPGLVTTILDMIPMILEAAISLFTALIESLPIILPLLITGILDLLPKIITTVIGMIPKLLTAAISLFTGIVSAIPKIIPELIPALLNLLPQIIGAIIGMIPELVTAGIDLIGGLVKGLWDAAGAVGSALLDIIGGAVDGFLAFLGIKSPSTVFAGFGGNLIDGLVKGLDGNARKVSKSVGNLSSLVTDEFNPEMDAGVLTASAAAGGRYGASRTQGAGAQYHIEVHALNANAETGRLIVQSIKDYERSGGRQ